MQRLCFQRLIIAVLLLCGSVAPWAASLVAVPTPQPYTTRLPQNIAAEVYEVVANAVASAGFSVMPEAASNELLGAIGTAGAAEPGAYLRERGVAGLLRTELNRGLGGFVLHVEPIGCASGSGLPTAPFDLQIGQYQNLRRCGAELAARLGAGATSAVPATMMTALLAPRIQEPLAPLFLGNYLGGRLENALLQRGYRLCAASTVEEALRQNRLGGFFELTRERCVNLGRMLQVASFIQVTIDTYQVYSENGGAVMCAKIGGTVREVSSANGELLQTVPIQLEVTSNDGRLGTAATGDAIAFGQAALDLVVREQILPHWPPRR